MQISLTCASSRIGRSGARMWVKEDASAAWGGASSLRSATTPLMSGSDFELIHGAKIDIARHDHLHATSLIDGDGRRDIDGVSQDIVRDLRAALGVHTGGRAGALLTSRRGLDHPITDGHQERPAKSR